MSGGIELEHRYGERGLERIGGRAFNHDASSHTEREYDDWRKQAREEIEKRRECMQRSREAYERGDGAAAKQLSNEGKRHAAQADVYNNKASNLVFNANNRSNGNDTIDLHGQYVTEAETRLEERIRKDQAEGKTHLHVIVGKGNHSADHIQKIKPAVEQVCRDLGLQYATEENAGRIYVNLQGGEVTHMPDLPPSAATQYSGYGGQHHGGHQQQQHHHPQQQQQNYGNQQQYHPSQQQQHHGGHHQQEEQADEVEKFLIKTIKKYCCAVM